MHKNYKKFLEQRRPANPLFLKVWETLSKTGELDGLSDDNVLRVVALTTKGLMEDYKSNENGTTNKIPFNPIIPFIWEDVWIIENW